MPGDSAALRPQQRGRQEPGPLLFARYAYPPNRLGLCGPADAPSLRGSAQAADIRQARELALGFEGAYPYLRLIAEGSGIADPLDRRVVAAYWIGGALADAVGRRAMHRSIEARFRDRMSGTDWRWLELAVAGGAHPIHAFHVLEVFPRSGLLRGGAAPLLETMDACRIRSGTVRAIVGDRLAVDAGGLAVVDGRLELTAPRPEVISAWSTADGPLGGVRPGDVVSIHWGWACERLTADQQRRLAFWTARAIASANSAI
jgi:hypothetical protein